MFSRHPFVPRAKQSTSPDAKANTSLLSSIWCREKGLRQSGEFRWAARRNALGVATEKVDRRFRATKGTCRRDTSTPASDNDGDGAYASGARQIAQGRRAFVVAAGR
jgi:hypothetical protein